MIKKFFKKIRDGFLKIKIYYIGDEILKKYANQYPKIKTINETIDKVITHGYSIVRYGDGEFTLALSPKKNLEFQKGSIEINKRLREILHTSDNKDNKVLVCIPPFYPKYNDSKNVWWHFSFWQVYWFKNFKKIKKFLVKNDYGNSFISRLDTFYEVNIEYMKKIWKNRDVVFVYSTQGRFDINHEIFSEIHSKQVLLIPAINAFEEYDYILEKCLQISKNKMFIIAAGPTATILAYDLSTNGYQALDIGHLSNSYDQYLGKIGNPEDLPYCR